MLYKIEDREHATILAALRLWQRRDEFFSNGIVEQVDDILTNDGTVEPLDIEEIDVLCESLNNDGIEESDGD